MKLPNGGGGGGEPLLLLLAAAAAGPSAGSAPTSTNAFLLGLLLLLLLLLLLEPGLVLASAVAGAAAGAGVAVVSIGACAAALLLGKPLGKPAPKGLTPAAPAAGGDGKPPAKGLAPPAVPKGLATPPGPAPFIACFIIWFIICCMATYEGSGAAGLAGVWTAAAIQGAAGTAPAPGHSSVFTRLWPLPLPHTS